VYQRVDGKKTNTYYLKMFLNSTMGRTLLEGVQTGSGMKVLNQKTLKIYLSR